MKKVSIILLQNILIYFFLGDTAYALAEEKQNDESFDVLESKKTLIVTISLLSLITLISLLYFYNNNGGDPNPNQILDILDSLVKDVGSIHEDIMSLKCEIREQTRLNQKCCLGITYKVCEASGNIDSILRLIKRRNISIEDVSTDS